MDFVSDDECLEYPEYYTRDEVYEVMRKKIKDLELQVIDESGHCFVGHENEVAEKVKEFIAN